MDIIQERNPNYPVAAADDRVERIVLVFLKAPVPGTVKTRLAMHIGGGRAAKLYRDWIGQVLDSMQPLRGRAKIVGCFDGGGIEAFHDWREHVDDWHPQSNGDLGRRLADAFAYGHNLATRVLAIGTDCLEISAALCIDAFDMLDDFQVVLGPAVDGGYYLIGTNTDQPRLFDGIRWSCGHTLADQRRRCRELGLQLGELGELRDIDTWDDWQAYCLRMGVRPN